MYLVVPLAVVQHELLVVRGAFSIFLRDGGVQPQAHEGHEAHADGEGQRVLAHDLLGQEGLEAQFVPCLLYTSPSPRDAHESRMPSSA